MTEIDKAIIKSNLLDLIRMVYEMRMELNQNTPRQVNNAGIQANLDAIVESIEKNLFKSK